MLLNIKTTTILHPSLLNSQIDDNLLTQIQHEYESKCVKSYGYILSINKLLNYESIISNANNQIMIHAQCQAQVLKPEPNQIHTSTIINISPYGIFTLTENRINSLIPLISLSNYTYNDTDKTFSNKKYTLKKGDQVTIKIKIVRYENKNFSCITELA